MTTADLLPGPAADHVAAPEPPRAGRAQRRAAARAFRPRRVLPAVVAAAVLAAASILAATEVISTLVNRPAHVLPVEWLARAGRDVHWDDPAALATAAVACALGIVLIALALAPGRSRMIALTSGDPQTVTGITRAGLRRYLAAAATRVDGIARARVRLGRRRVRVKAASPLRDARGLSGQVEQAVTACLEELAPLRPRRLRVAVRRKED
jgi:Family of unknown function (DUF6286)